MQNSIFTKSYWMKGDTSTVKFCCHEKSQHLNFFSNYFWGILGKSWREWSCSWFRARGLCKKDTSRECRLRGQTSGDPILRRLLFSMRHLLSVGMARKFKQRDCLLLVSRKSRAKVCSYRRAEPTGSEDGDQRKTGCH